MAQLPPFDAEWLRAEQMIGPVTTLLPGPVNDIRTQFEAILAGVVPFLPPPTGAVMQEDVHIEGNQRLRIYVPRDLKEPVPVGLYIHCGGWFSGSIEGEDFLCRNISETSKIILFSPEYRLAPEHPYPAGLDGCCTAYEWMHANASKFGGDNTKKFIMGGSAGGNLTACVGLKYATNPELRPSGLIVACAQTCDVSAFPEKYKRRFTPEKYTDSPLIGREIMLQAAEWYAPSRLDDPLYSPLLHPDIKHLPPTYLAAPTKDPTHQETVFFAEELTAQGVKADLVEWEGWPHFFWILPMLKKSSEFMEVWNEKLSGMMRLAS